MSSTVEEAAPPAEVPGVPRLSHRQIVTILSGLMCGMFLAALDQTIVGTAIVKIANDLHGFNLQAWATTAYLITATISTPIYGKLSDIYGRKPFYLAAISIFVIGSAASSFSTSMYELAAFRAVQGLGAGGLMSLAITILGDIVSPRERAKYQGYILSVFGLSTVLGPVLGGFLAGIDHAGSVFGYDIHGWRWVFLINVPIGAVALFVVARVLNVPHNRHDHKIDWWGALALMIALVPLLIVAEQGRSWGWGSDRAVLCYIVGGVGVIAFITIETLMKDAALIPLRLFKNSTFTIAIVGGIILGVAMFGAIMMIPQFLQVVQGYTPTQSGLLMLPLMAGIMFSSIVSGRITAKTGRYKIFPIIGTLFIVGGDYFFAQVDWDTRLWHPLVAAAIIGLGLGQCMQTLTIAAQNAGPRSDMGVSTASATFFRQIGGTAGVAVFLTILFSVLPGNITKAFGGHPPAGAGGKLGDLQSNTGVIQSLPARVRVPVLTGFTNSIDTVFYVAGGVALLATLVLLFMKEIPLLGGAPAASAVEGADARLDEPADEPTEILEPVRLDDREPALVGAEGPLGGREFPSQNGHRYDQAVSSPLPIRSPALASSGMDVPAEAGGVPVVGRVRRQDGTHVGGAALTLIDQRGHQVARVIGNADGSYSVPTQGRGAYVLIVSAPGHRPEASSVLIKNGPANVDVTLTGTAELNGMVRAIGARAPLPNVTVTLTDEAGEVNGACITAADGKYAFAGINAGHYTLVASGPSYRPVAVTLTMPESGVLRHDVALCRAVLLSGVARTEGDRTVPDARITVLDTDGNVAAVARTDDEGRYVVSDLPEGEYTIVASGYPPVSSRVGLAGDDTEHDVMLSYEQAFDQWGDQL